MMLNTMQAITYVLTDKLPVPLPIVVQGAPWWIQNVVSAVVGAIIASVVGLVTARSQSHKQTVSERSRQFSLLFTELHILNVQINRAVSMKDPRRSVFLFFTELPTWNTLRPLLSMFIDPSKGTQRDAEFIQDVDSLQETSHLMNSMVQLMRESAISGNATFQSNCREQLNSLLKRYQSLATSLKKSQDYIREQISH